MNRLLDEFLNSNGVSSDTRNIKANQLFFALKGPNFNGNTYAKTAVENGAKLCICDEKLEIHEPFSGQIVYVQNALEALQNLANQYRKHLGCFVIGLTGSNGKTTTKELILKCLSRSYKIHGTPGNLNNHIGLPLSILSAPKDTEVLLLEMGDNKLGDIRELCHIALPDLGIITNVGKDHIGGFGSFENNVKSKLELFDYCMRHDAEILYDPAEEALNDFTKAYAAEIPFTYHTFKLNSKGLICINYNNKSYQTGIPGDYNIQNINIALALCARLEIEPEVALEAICEYIPKNNRSQIESTEKNEIFLDAYNANPSSVEKSIHFFNQIKTDKAKHVILGGMRELGQFSEAEHKQILGLLQRHNFNTVWLVGEEFKPHAKDFPKFHFFENTEAVSDLLKEKPLSNLFVLLKGSRSYKLEKLVDLL